MANDLQVNTSVPMAGLGNFAFTTTADGFYSVSCESTIPLGSALQIEFKQNSTSKGIFGGASTNPTPTQESLAGSVKLQCTAGDVIHVILTSANSVDSLPNNVKSVINLFQGQ